MTLDRRVFILSAAALPLYAGPLITFSDTEAKLVSAIADRIIPADDEPGAEAAGVVFYIDKQLAGPLKRFRPAYTSALSRWNSLCQEQTGKAFAELTPEARTEFLRQAELKPDWKLASFLQLIIDHTMQGFYGSPEHGGNRGDASWKMLGIEDVMAGHKH